MKILLATDGSRHSRSAVDLLTQTPFAAPGNEVGVLVVLPAAKPAARTAPREAAEKLARGTAQRLQYVGCAAHTVLREGHVARCIVETAEEFGAELVVVGSRGLCGARRFRTGQVSQKTMQRAPCSVLVIRQPEERATAQGTNEGSALRILVAFDGSESARAAVEALAALPLPDDTEITSAYADSAFSGYMDFEFWDAFPAPGGGYVPQLPAPRLLLQPGAPPGRLGRSVGCRRVR